MSTIIIVKIVTIFRRVQLANGMFMLYIYKCAEVLISHITSVCIYLLMVKRQQKCAKTAQRSVHAKNIGAS